ncbi:Gfo/Idh/MocA family protein [Pelagibius sp. Alg239-R121]|uniref:Gfo/Idh/MocA family protein n=1 Tax=Pelagibius sp. Alg239-R121 TaxID=2993448 RepID=UPI0024A65B07|nr:Gfo/Idh/MocA family oxidoreductase [Pelagibius sp. Alg239-R121]
MDKARWGVVSTANIGLEKVIPGIQRSRLGRVSAIASRNLEKAKAAAADLGIERAYGSYEELLNDPEIEFIYNPLPNDQHVDVTLAAARAGKHVLCEKPIGLNADDAARLSALPDDIRMMEAFMVRFHPQWLRCREILQSGKIGKPTAIQVAFSYFNNDSNNIRNHPEKGGGALLDIGCYAIVAGRFFFEAEPKRVIALIDRDPDFETDRLTSGLLDFGKGRQLAFTVSTQAALYQRVQILGTDGRLEIEIPFNASQGAVSRLFLYDGSVLDGSDAKTEVVPEADQYAEQADAFVEAVKKGQASPYGLDDAMTNMRIIDALFRSAERDSWQEP